MGTAAVDRFVRINGLRLHYREWPHERARPLLLLHGLTGHARMWDTVARALQRHYGVIALDARGHGESDHADDYSSEQHVNDLEGFVSELGLRDLAVVGVSDGGWHARNYACRRPAALTALVLVDSALPHPQRRTAADPRDAGTTEPMPPPPEFFDDPKSGADALIAMYTFYGSGPQAGSDPAVSRREWKEFLGSNMKSTPDGRWTWRWDQRLLTPAPPQPAGTPQLSYEEQAALRWKEFAQIDCPVLVVRGELSGRIAHETVTLMAERFPNVRVVEIPKAGHVVPLDEPRGLLDALAEFLAASRSS